MSNPWRSINRRQFQRLAHPILLIIQGVFLWNLLRGKMLGNLIQESLSTNNGAQLLFIINQTTILSLVLYFIASLFMTIPLIKEKKVAHLFYQVQILFLALLSLPTLPIYFPFLALGVWGYRTHRWQENFDQVEKKEKKWSLFPRERQN